MKTQYFFILLIILSVLSCSKDESDEIELTITRCFTVKKLGTEIRIGNARVALNGPLICDAFGCGPLVIANKPTDINGEVCFTISEISNEEIESISCIHDGYHYFTLSSPSLDFSEIYLVPF